MAFVCLPAAAAKAFKKALATRDLQIADLLKMSTEERTKVFETFAGKQAKEINQLFEEKLVLKNKVLGLKNFIAKVAQEGKYDPARKAQLDQLASEFRQRQQERIFNPTEEQTFLNDLADSTIDAHITRAQSKTMFDLSMKTDEALQKYDATTKTWSSPEAKADYGGKKVAYQNYINALKEGDTSIRGMLKDVQAKFREDFKENKPKAVRDVITRVAKEITDNSIAVVASLDNSFMGRQGLKTLMTHPTVWWDGAKNSITDIAKTIGGEETRDALMADIYSNPNYLDGSYHKAGLLPKTEEQFPTSLPSRIPVLGRAFKASEAAFEGSAIRMRTGLYDLLAKKAEENGVDMKDSYQVESLGKMINSLTARGQWGKRGEPAVTRLLLWAPKMIKANIDVLTAHTGQDISAFARKEAAINLVKIVAISAGIMTIANAIKPGSAEMDSRSSDFGKIKIGNTRFDYTGGASSLIVLATRLLTSSSKSSTTGLVKDLNSGDFGAQTRLDVVVDFLAGKTPPITGAFISQLRGADFKGDRPTLAGTIENTTVPIALQNAIALKDDSSVAAVLGVLVDVFGVNSTTFTRSKTDWSKNPGVELQAFEKKIGPEKFKAANADFNKQVDALLATLPTNAKYQALSAEDKQRVITKKKDEIKEKVFKSNGFKYKQAPTKKTPTI